MEIRNNANGTTENRIEKKTDSRKPSADSIYWLFLFDLGFEVDYLEYKYEQHEHVSFSDTN